MYVVNEKKNDVISDLEIQCFKGDPYIVEEMDGLKFKIGPVSFFQTNSSQARTLYQKTIEFSHLSGSDTVYDLYTGTGTIANFIASKAKKVIGIEYIESAVHDAIDNSDLNGINNCQFFSGDIAEVLNSNFVKTHGHPDVVITDPPRAGMHKKVVDQLVQILPDRIVYISCNPPTQARDVELLSDHYNVAKIQAIDMFPHTHHVENIMLMVRKK